MYANNKNSENYIIELYNRIKPDKFIIIIISIIFFFLGKIYLYFIIETYESYAIIKVRIEDYEGADLLRKNLSKTNTGTIKQEMALLKTYQINKVALEKINFQIQYFKDKHYKKIELYKNIPIKINSLENINKNYIGQLLTLEVKDNGFQLYSDKLPSTIIYTFSEKVKTPFFSIEIEKIENFKKLYIKFNGANRLIFESYIQGNLDITEVTEGANLLKINYTDSIQERANDYTNALVNAYIEKSIKKKENTNNKILSFLIEELKRAKEKLKESEGKLQRYKTSNSINPSIKLQDSFEKLSNIDLELAEFKLKEKLIKNLLAFIRNNRYLNAIGPTLIEFNDQSTIKLSDLLQTLLEEEDELSDKFTDKYLDLITIRKKIKRIKAQILQNIQNLEATLIFKRKDMLKQKLKYEKILKTLPSKEKDLISFQSEYEADLKMYTYLLGRKSENELIKVATVSDYEIVDAAYGSNIPVRPKRLVILILAGLMGLVMGVIFSLLRSQFIHKIYNKKDIERLTNIPFYGMIPIYKEYTLFTVSIKEAYHKLATNLLFSNKEEGNIVLITSYEKGEGKTTTIASLAAVFNNLGIKTILIDFNLREPALHNYFGMEHQHSGISTFLSNRDNIGNIIFSTNYPNLDIITSGPTAPNPIELTISPKLPELLAILQKRYSYIIIDTNCYKDAHETLHLMKYADVNLVMFRENFSKKMAVDEMGEIMKQKGIKNIGLVYKYVPKDEIKLNEYELIQASILKPKKTVKLI